MSAVVRKTFGGTPSSTNKTPLNTDQLRRDRRTAIIVLAVMAALLGLVIWLASMSGGGVQEGIDYWPKMP